MEVIVNQRNQISAPNSIKERYSQGALPIENPRLSLLPDC